MDTAISKPKAATGLSKGYLIAITGTVIWSTTAIFIRYLNVSYQLPPLVLAFWRDVFVFAGLAVFFAFFSPRLLKVERRQMRFLALYGFLLSLFNSLWTVSVALNGAAVSTVLAYSSAGFSAILGWLLFQEPLHRAKIAAVLFSILGCLLVSGAYDPAAWQLNPLGILVGISSGVAFASYSLMGKAAARRAINSWTALLYTFGFAAIFLMAYNFVPGWLPGGMPGPNLLWLGSSLTGWAFLTVLALGPTIGGYGLYTLSLTYLPVSVANLIATLEPSMTAVQAYLFLGERLTGPQLIGSALVIAGVVLLRMSEGFQTAAPGG